MNKIKVTLVKSTIGSTKVMKDTVRSLGLRKINSSAIHDNTDSIRGMAQKVCHLIKVEDVEDKA